MKRRNTYRRGSKTRRRRNRRFSRRRATRMARGQRQRGGFFAYRPANYALSSYWVAGEEEAPRLMTAKQIEEKRTEDDKGT